MTPLFIYRLPQRIITRLMREIIIGSVYKCYGKGAESKMTYIIK